MTKPRNSNASFEKGLTKKRLQPRRYQLRLYVAGSSPKSLLAIRSARQICDENLEGRYSLEVIDIFQQPKLAKDDQIIAVPTLIKKLPAPLRRFIGDLSDRDVVIVGLDLKRKG